MSDFGLGRKIQQKIGPQMSEFGWSRKCPGRKSGVLPAHQLILKNASDVFEEMFRSSVNCPVVEVRDVEAAAFKVMLSFIYTDDLSELNEHNAMAVLYAGTPSGRSKMSSDGIECSSGNRRSVLGPALFKIRFPNIHEEDFTKCVGCQCDAQPSGRCIGKWLRVAEFVLLRDHGRSGQKCLTWASSLARLGCQFERPSLDLVASHIGRNADHQQTIFRKLPNTIGQCCGTHLNIPPLHWQQLAKSFWPLPRCRPMSPMATSPLSPLVVGTTRTRGMEFYARTCTQHGSPKSPETTFLFTTRSRSKSCREITA
ncbi:hypothetical protein niasHT_028788 [Heterodera trifolii]|uniref:BTB domain-containing protein n=1 Tax=Heterodera trifolii TaxID=157864 RepID=A0ABD2KQH9_9BILA